jgi:hypothetical protein
LTGSLLASPTTSPPGALLGSQTPRVRNVPPYVKTYGPEVIDLMAEIGRPLDPWQATIALDAFGVRLDGLWSAFELLVLLSRQNGKGGVTEAIELGGLFLFREPLILHSAHQFKTSTAAFRRLQDIIEGSDWLTRRVKMISRSKGDESIELTRAAGGGRLQFVARTLGSARGLTGSKNVFDEAWALTVGQYAAQTPTLATIPNPQIIYTTTPPDDDIGPVPTDAMLPSVRQRAHDGDDRIAVYEWSPPKDYDRTDRQVWYECNPALGIRISEWFLAKQLAAFTKAGRPEKFDTEHLGDWPIATTPEWQVLSKADWEAAYDPDSKPEDPVAFAIAANPDRTWATIGVAGLRADGGKHVEVVDRQPGTGWVVTRLVALQAWRPCAVAVVASGPAGSLITDLEAEGIEVLKVSQQEYQRACGSVYDGVGGRRAEGQPDPRVIRYTGRPELTEALTAAVKAAGKHGIGDTWTWDRDMAADASPIEAVTCALYAHALKAPEWQADYDVLDSVR